MTKKEQKNGSKIALIIALSTTEYQYKGWYIVHLARRAAFSEKLVHNDVLVRNSEASS